MPRVIDVGLGKKPLSLEELEEILGEVERMLSRELEERLGRRLEELDIVVEGVLSPDGRNLQILIDVRATGRLIAPLSYDEVVAEAIDAAAKWLERRLRSRLAKGEGGGAARAS
ncbi:hypothetical protein [Hyperthermus butylicus]|uniref:Uncharacterized protein n=1 Tax=Hyperthermus butylicus (strain DSM 5456 / JCM 9403 / PLM1-5) TaxID=415426 RepID=A2BKC5_HYPBU|nr:hypothetical protein [Hyperthermus butylicus]ABM80436.1 hypothetical protein Hbut_0576 [Hyperthermus butylicus DSM 5456]